MSDHDPAAGDTGQLANEKMSDHDPTAGDTGQLANEKMSDHDPTAGDTGQLANEKMSDHDPTAGDTGQLANEKMSDHDPTAGDTGQLANEKMSDHDPTAGDTGQLANEKMSDHDPTAGDTGQLANEKMSDHDPTAGDTGQLANEKASDIPVTEGINKEEEYLDILGNGSLMKKVIEAGNGKRPSMGDKVKVSLIQEIPVLQRTFPQEDLDFVLGDGDVIQALDLVVALMDIGEKAIVVAGSKFMYGELGLLPDVPPNADFKLTVHLISSNGPPNYDSMNFDTRFGEAKKKKERGNFLFKRTEYALALNSYVKASKIVDPNEGCIYMEESPEKLQELLEFRAIVLCNTSASQYKIDAYEAAVRSAKEASDMWPSYSKAYYRLGQAEEKLGNIDETIRSYKLALRYDADNSKVIHSELTRLTKINKKNKESQQEMYSKMFWGSKPPSMNKTNKDEVKSKVLPWLWKAAGGAAMGAGMVGLTSYCLYKYMNN